MAVEQRERIAPTPAAGVVPNGVHAPVPASPIPPLENGDRLTRAEFERRYEAMPDLKKAELIEGEVYVGSPVREIHGEPHADVIGWLSVYRASTPGVRVADNTTVRLDLDNEFQPDALLRLDAKVGGAAHSSDDGYTEGPPELVVEVAASSVSIDRHKKLHVYRRSGVREYVVWQVQDEKLEWLVLEDGEYVPLQPDERGVLHSRAFPGLRLLASALLIGDLGAVLAEQQAGIASPEHQQFVASLQERVT